MDKRILLVGIIPLFSTLCGIILLGFTYSLSYDVITGFLLIILPVICLIWYTLIRVEQLKLDMKYQTRITHRIINEQVVDMKRRYEEIMRQMMDVNAELQRRIYR